jgi:peptidoglycan-associated lipoprotein
MTKRFWIGLALAPPKVVEEQPPPEEKAAIEEFPKEDIHFEFDKSSLLPEAQDDLRAKAKWLMAHPDVSAIIEGHCDERGTNEYNIALGDRRAGSAETFLVDLGIEASRLSTISYGEEKPFDPGHDEEAWAKNRRVHFVIE